jgi:hypothetical protein
MALLPKKNTIMKYVKLFEEFTAGLKPVKENLTFADIADNIGSNVKKEERGILAALKYLKATSANQISNAFSTLDGDEDLYDAIDDMAQISIDSNIYDKAYTGKYNGKDVVVFDSEGDLFAFVKESASLMEGTVSFNKVIKALYGTTSQTGLPRMTEFLGVGQGDTVTIVAVSAKGGAELFNFVMSMPKGTAWMSKTSSFVAAFKNMSQRDYNALKAAVPSATVTGLDMFNPVKSSAQARAYDQKISAVDSVADASTTY